MLPSVVCRRTRDDDNDDAREEEEEDEGGDSDRNETGRRTILSPR